MQFDKILSYTDELLADLDALMRIESVDGENNEACQQALDFMLSRAKDFGLVPERVTDKSGQVDLGTLYFTADRTEASGKKNYFFVSSDALSRSGGKTRSKRTKQTD